MGTKKVLKSLRWVPIRMSMDAATPDTIKFTKVAAGIYESDAYRIEHTGLWDNGRKSCRTWIVILKADGYELGSGWEGMDMTLAGAKELAIEYDLSH